MISSLALATVAGLLLSSALQLAAGRLLDGGARPDGGAVLARHRPYGLCPQSGLATAVLLAGCVATFGLSARTLVASLFCAILVLLSAIDIDRRIVPNRIVIPAAVAVLVAQTLLQPRLEWLLAALGAAAFLLVVALVNPGGMGMGDVKLALLLGAGLGRAVPLAIALGLISALVPALVLVVRHGRGARGKGIPFAPFLALGAVVTLFLQGTLAHG